MRAALAGMLAQPVETAGSLEELGDRPAPDLVVLHVAADEAPAVAVAQAINRAHPRAAFVWLHEPEISAEEVEAAFAPLRGVTRNASVVPGCRTRIAATRNPSTSNSPDSTWLTARSAAP